MHFERTTDQLAEAGAPMEAASHLQWYRAVLLILLALCAYLSVPLLSGGRLLVPSFPTVALTPLLLLTVWPNFSQTDIVFLLKIGVVLLVSIALSPGYEYIDEKLFGLIQCGMAIAVAIMIVRLMQQIRREFLERTLLVLSLLIVVGAILEVLGPLRDISDAFREWAYSQAYYVYDRDLRDINMVGWPRPKLFSVEPSHVTKLFIAAINSWLLIRVSWGKVAIVTATTLIMLLIMGSPMLLVSAAITLAILIWDRGAGVRAKMAMILGALLIGVICGTYFVGSRYSAIATRVASVGESTNMQSSEGEGGSEEKRIIYPYITLADTWRRWPLFGVGIGGKEIVFENTKLSVRRKPEAALGNNAMAEFGIYLGLVGGAWFIYLLLRQARHTGVHRVGLIIVILAMYSQLMGGVDSFRYWGFVALFWGALAVGDSKAVGNEASAGAGIRQ